MNKEALIKISNIALRTILTFIISYEVIQNESLNELEYIYANAFSVVLANFYTGSVFTKRGEKVGVSIQLSLISAIFILLLLQFPLSINSFLIFVAIQISSIDYLFPAQIRKTNIFAIFAVINAVSILLIFLGIDLLVILYIAFLFRFFFLLLFFCRVDILSYISMKSALASFKNNANFQIPGQLAILVISGAVDPASIIIAQRLRSVIDLTVLIDYRFHIIKLQSLLYFVVLATSASLIILYNGWSTYFLISSLILVTVDLYFSKRNQPLHYKNYLGGDLEYARKSRFLLSVMILLSGCMIAAFQLPAQGYFTLNAICTYVFLRSGR